MNQVSNFTKGFIRENAVFTLLLGLCPTLAVTSSATNGLGMGLATTFVLVCSNVVVSLVKNLIPDKVRIPAFIVIIASFVSMVDLLMQGFVPALAESLGIFIPLIVVNCVVLGRAEAFASKNGPMLSVADGLGIGLGFTLSLAALGGVREIIGAGTLTIWGGVPAFTMGDWYMPFQFMIEAPGAFVGLGLMLCLMNLIGSK